jgi:hypothetical protein
MLREQIVYNIGPGSYLPQHFSPQKNGATTFGIMTVSITTFSIMPLIIMTFSPKTFIIMPLSIMTLSITTNSLMTLDMARLSVRLKDAPQCMSNVLE